MELEGKLEVGEVVKVHFTALAQGGTAVGTVLDGKAGGMKVFVPGVIPNETALVTITENKGRFCNGELKELLEKSKHRIEPSCPYFAECGGCDLQYIDIEAQRKFKKDFVLGTFKYQAGIEVPENTITNICTFTTGLPSFNYRRRITLHADGSGRLGFFKKKSGEVIDCKECKIIVKELNDILPILRSFVKENAEFVSGIVLEFHNDSYFLLIKSLKNGTWAKLTLPLQSYFRAIHVTNNDKLIYRYNASKDEVFPFGHFCQVNAEANTALVNYVLTKLKASEITEFYAGAGNFTFPLASQNKNIIAVELDSALIKYANFLKSSKNLTNLNFVCSSTERYLKDVAAHKTVLSETILLDPPRSGAKCLADFCNPQKQRKIVYVSCNPATLARDIKILLEKGYQIQDVAIFDMFPQTQHIETVVTLNLL